ncbi:hypothetical protein POTOM_032447 [Populus tomentosa]|uniref:Cyclin-dependent protein kinase inhibitor SMR2 n=1 Tax=Populus tomentosa TaxID=118781 RepID=A0A8X7Z0A7_POPTO|nr:hypothetical protein POTOM_032447 [Populus tomentosa]
MSKDHQTQKNLQKLQQSVSQGHEQEEGELENIQVDDQEECKTPTSGDHKIPAIQSCPPTPRKKMQVFEHKRKLPEFFETTNNDEVEITILAREIRLCPDGHEDRRPRQRREKGHYSISIHFNILVFF